jgi:hypothetical protein
VSPEAATKGLGYMSPGVMLATHDVVTSALGLKCVVPPEELYTNEFLALR